MTSTTQPGTRERLLRTAADLFYAEGIHAVGVERLCQAAGVSKRSMYQLFATKDDVVAESLRQYGPVDVADYFAADGTESGPREAILRVFRRLRERAGEPGFHGCPFINTAVETRDPDGPAAGVARDGKDRLQEYFAGHAARAGAADPALLGAQLTIVFDGAAVRAVMRGADDVAERTAAALLDAAGC
jgi:AcrR family transcriptional regulator